MKRYIVAFVTVMILIMTGYVPAHSSTWSITLGGTGADYAQSVQPTSDDGSIVAGYTNSFGAVGNDAWIVKLNADGSTSWQKTYGGAGDDRAYSVQQTLDGGYIVSGFSNSFGTSGYTPWILKLDSNGDLTWQKYYNITVSPSAYPSIQQTIDNGYIVTYTFTADSIPYIMLLKLNSNGSLAWMKSHGYAANTGKTTRPTAVRQTSDNGYIVAGYTNAFGSGNYDAWILKLDSNGDITWHNTYGGAGDDRAHSVRQTTDGGYIVAGKTGGSSAWVLKLDSGGGITWQKAYSSSYANAIQQTAEGGYIVTGNMLIPATSTYNLWMLKLTADGVVSWQKKYGSIGDAYDVRQTSDSGYIVAGRLANGANGDDALVLKLDQNGSIGDCSKIAVSSAAEQTATGAAATLTIGTLSSSTDYSINSTATVANTTVIPGVVCSGITFPLGTALDNNSLTFTVDAFPWEGVTDITAVGGSSARSGSIAHNGVSALTTSVQGPGELSFLWKVSSEGGYDYLHFYIDDVEKTKISGAKDWATLSYSVTAGTHTLKWSYTKDYAEYGGSDAGWVDQVVFTSTNTSVSWDNIVGGFWRESANWSLDTVPGLADDVTIDYGTGTVTVDTTAAAKTLTVGGEKNISLSTGKLTLGAGD